MFHGYVSLPEGKSHELLLNQHFPMVFLWFSCGFPVVFHGYVSFPEGKPIELSQCSAKRLRDLQAAKGGMQPSDIHRLVA